MCPAVCWGKSENYVRSPSSRGMAGLEVADGLEAKLGPVVFALSRYGREYEPEVVARIYAVNDLANKPPGTFGEHDGASNWPRLPPTKRELVDVVTCLFTEKPSQTDVGSPKRVEDYQVGCGRDVERPVELRDANVPTRRTDAALCGEAHEAAGAAVIARDCKHVHRVVQMGDKTMVRFLVLAVQSAPNRSTSHGRHLSWRASSSTLRPSRHRLSLCLRLRTMSLFQRLWARPIASLLARYTPGAFEVRDQRRPCLPATRQHAVGGESVIERGGRAAEVARAGTVAAAWTAPTKQMRTMTTARKLRDKRSR